MPIVANGGATLPEFECRICGGQVGSVHQVREMMFGSGASYRYFHCVGCGCIQLGESVTTAEQYPIGYYAYEPQPIARGARALLRKWRNRGVFRGGVGRLLALLKPYPVRGAERWFRRIAARLDTRILDVGCGTAEVLRDLADAGFTGIEGIDPLLPGEILRRMPSFVRKTWLHEATGEFDIVMFHHVLEHMPDQEGALRHAVRLLRPGGHCLVRVPVINEAWNRYRENWVQLDAPRHLFVHSINSLTIVAQRAGLELEYLEYDSTEFQFTGSELFSRGIPLTDLPRAFSAGEVRRYRREARLLNARGLGDQAAFYFRKPKPSLTWPSERHQLSSG